MSEIVLSAFLSVIFEKLASATLEKLSPYNEINSEIQRLQRSLFQVQVLLTDASEKEAANQYVKRRLNGLQHLAYDIDDILDDLATQAMDREFSNESETHTGKVRKFLSNLPFSKHSLRTRMMKDKINEITTKLHDLIEEKAILSLIVKEETRSNRRLQTSMVHASSIVGRQAEKEALVHRLLLGGESSDQNFSIVPIVGMGGVGKTTLARLLYDDEQVDSHFKLKAWACVSDDFDSVAISKVIFQSVTGENKDFADLNLLQVALKGHLRGKRFLLVLDDVWSESCDDWETLIGPFHVCAPGSKIIMTTRKDQLLRKLGCNNLNELKSVSHEDALSLFALHSLGVNNFESHLSLKPLGEGIVKKCDGLPLALKALGRLLSTKKEQEYWKQVLDSEIWNLPVEGEIIPALKLSYLDLSACLKQLFAYCSLFPKDYVFDKEEIVLLWMGEGFLHHSPPRDATEESTGYDYFNELLSRSFFQHAPNNKSLFVMHDMINDLATYAAGEFFVRLDSEAKEVGKEMLEKYRHMSLVREQFVTHKKLEAFKKSKSLRTILATSVGEVDSLKAFFLSNNVIVDLLPELPLLRVICLSSFRLTEVPESIGTLRHLRYLNLSRTLIRHLPETVCSLNNLQTLIVAGCRVLAKLPDNFFKLKNMRHLDIRDTPLLKNLPLGIYELKNLQTLSKIIIGGESGIEISRLKDFQNLRGNISIVGLDKVQNAIHVWESNVSQMKLTALEVTWTDMLDGSRNEMLEHDVLNELKPCNDKLMQLKIRLYGGFVFPNWVGDPSFIHLKHVSVFDCKKCTSLPPLGQLPSLKELFIEGLDGVEVVGFEFLGTGIAFRSLELLSFVHMSGWKKWSTNIADVFPCLQELLITNCPNLSQVSLVALPSLKVLKIERCDSYVLRSLVHVASSVTKLEIKSISGLTDVVWKCVIKYLTALEDLEIWDCNEITFLWEPEATNILVSLRRLQVWNCDNVECCICLDRIETFYAINCTSVIVISFPMRGEKLKSLNIIGCGKLLETGWSGSNMPLLEVVWIKRYETLKSITELNCLVHLTQLSIQGCENLESFPIIELPHLTSLKTLRIMNCPSMNACFPCGVWPPNLRDLGIGKLKKPISKWGPQNFPPSLVHLQLYGEDGVSNFSHLSHLLPSYLTHLNIENFEKLESVSVGLQHLTSLQHLRFINCPNMMHLPRMLLPSLLSLGISSCPKLEERCRKGGFVWHLISHIPKVWLSHELWNQ